MLRVCQVAGKTKKHNTNLHLKIDNRGQKKQKKNNTCTCVCVWGKNHHAPGVVDCLIDYFPKKIIFIGLFACCVVCVCVSNCRQNQKAQHKLSFKNWQQGGRAGEGGRAKKKNPII